MTASRFIVPSIAMGLLIFSPDQGTAADNERGAQLVAMCAACHRLDGHDTAIPSIVRMDVQKLAEAMAAFKSGARSSQIMHAVALQLSDAEIETLAEYLAARPMEGRLR
jgi:sulfide dehydrogenase cytochrome subunit